ncbi:hypothetical protein B9G99_13520 [Kushneria konosiri]|uniref:Uncharacterized protein n=1 Tax=Kushneria konosiri TaxID=698828 RepID=A0A2Z2H8F2_9GAMM|nr:hypothetical protein B9G99_13520 [Kushneria konosiri]
MPTTLWGDRAHATTRAVIALRIAVMVLVYHNIATAFAKLAYSPGNLTFSSRPVISMSVAQV